MTGPGGSFDIELEKIAPVADDTLPRLSEMLRKQRDIVIEHEGLEGAGAFAAVFPAQRAYARYTDQLGVRLWLGAERIEETAQALREIIELYRRADAQ
ncbi:hypothetical protein [Actinokineospora sp. UTMC 2448]|uniref:hypothetical protein n=1 Tax=Actinokineospora sp. UTMC 2448 TaxID=2268449 RepID=UPI002164B76D|nr:hypothetical protein [Actinokineospora sp. UTMC 2448]UVS81919.1 hypothetical protein Actkin_05683 [Actinokineospora sp. UTMC 2448]